MAGTVTVVRPMVTTATGSKMRISVALTTSTTASGEPIDLSAYFGYVESIVFAGVDATADATWTFQGVGPGAAVAVTSSNIIITATHGSGADAVNNHADAEDLSSVGALMLDVEGKQAIATSWA